MASKGTSKGKGEGGIADVLRRLRSPRTDAVSAPRAAESTRRTEPEIRLWLIQQVAEITGVPDQEIDSAEPFSSYGLGSREGLALSGKLEQWLELKLPPSLVWEFPTIDEVAAFVWDPERVRDYLSEGPDPPLLDG